MEEKKYLKLNDVEAYKIAFHLSNYVWAIAVRWNNFTKDALGKNLYVPLTQSPPTLQKASAGITRMKNSFLSLCIRGCFRITRLERKS